MTPNDRRYTRDHEWILIEGNSARIGITDYAQDALGEIVYVELPAVGDSYAVGDSLAVVESVKAVSQIYTCVEGTVTEVNEALEEAPELLNSAAFDTCIAVLEIASVDESKLMSAQEYDAHVAAL
ncbi:MAG: glycine cleavage system protein GcvH [Clostridia bacterium]|nr:glycine cleavage system protein GcvH [Clostridia bacterium]